MVMDSPNASDADAVGARVHVCGENAVAEPKEKSITHYIQCKCVLRLSPISAARFLSNPCAHSNGRAHMSE